MILAGIACTFCALNQPYSLISSERIVDIAISKSNKITLDVEMVAGRLITDFKLNGL